MSVSKSALLPRVLLGAVLAVGLLIVLNGLVRAHLSFDSPLHQYAGGSCQDTPMGDGDWVNIVFVGARNQTEVQRLIARYLGWRAGMGGSVACFKDHGSLEPEDGMMASHSWFQERWHIRFNKSSDSAHILAAVHYDECNPYDDAGAICVMRHDGTDFEGARDTVATAFSQANHRVECGGETFRREPVECPTGSVAYIRIR